MFNLFNCSDEDNFSDASSYEANSSRDSCRFDNEDTINLVDDITNAIEPIIEEYNYNTLKKYRQENYK